MDGFETPIIGFRFQVDFKEQMLANATEGGEVLLCRGAFAECSGLEVTMEPKTIKEGAPKDEALKMKEKLEAAGAKVEIK